MSEIKYGYYYGDEAEQFTFYRIPKLLMKGEQFKDVTIESKILYGLLLDRMSLSIRNKWLDEENRVYIIYTYIEIMEDLGCAEQKASKLLSELERFGLVERKRRGLGKPNIIYVKNLVIKTQPESQFKNCESHNSRTSEITNQEFPESQFKNCENHNSGAVIIKEQELRKSQTNKTDINNTEFSDTDFKDTEKSDTEMNENNLDVDHPILSNPIINQAGRRKNDGIDEIGAYETYKKIVESNIESECLAGQYGNEAVEGIVELMTEIICSRNPYITVSCSDMPHEVVKSRFLKLNYSHIEYVLDCIKKNTTKIRNIKSYLVSALYNSYTTIDHYYTAEVNHDMYGGVAL